MQVRPLRYARRWCLDGSTVAYGQQWYVTPGRRFQILFGNGGWWVQPGKISHVAHTRLTATGLFATRFDRRRDALEALEATIASEEIEEAS